MTTATVMKGLIGFLLEKITIIVWNPHNYFLFKVDISNWQVSVLENTYNRVSMNTAAGCGN